ncbi:MAG: GNAT family N-acetyltransferase [bacterium]|jgi:RimJ/RimL family protein N-acetyltransferase
MKGLRLRDAKPADRDAVLEFCRNTWIGYGDYIPRVWDKWIRDRRGRFILAELDGTPIGMAKISDFGRGEVWLEGLRVTRRHRRQGIAHLIHLEVVKTLRRIKPRVVRYCTGATNTASRKVGAKVGFGIVARTRYYWSKPGKGKIRGEWAKPSEAGEIHSFMLASRFLYLTSGLLSEGWVFRELTRALLVKYIKERRVIVTRRAGRLDGVAVYPYEENDRTITLGFIDGSENAIRDLARNCRYLARENGYRECSVAVPTRVYARLIEEAGYKRKNSVRQVVLEIKGSMLTSGRKGASGRKGTSGPRVVSKRKVTSNPRRKAGPRKKKP